MPPDKSNKEPSDWYSVSVETVRGCLLILLVAALLVGGYFGYRALKPQLDEKKAAEVIDEARNLMIRLQQEQELGSYLKEYQAARESLERALERYAEREFGEALTNARTARTVLTTILDALLHDQPAGEAQFISVQGGVEFRRGELGEWQQADGRAVLRSGDYVKTTAGGLAELMFEDGTLYTVRPNTMFRVGEDEGQGERGGDNEQAIAMEYGWVNLSTAKRGSRVTTPGAEARVARESEGLVAYDQDIQSSRFAAYRGSMEVTAAGKTREVQELQEVQVKGTQVSAPKPLPERPELMEPEDNLEIDLVERGPLLFRWEPVDHATRYALQVSRNRLFVDNIIETEDRKGTSATLGIRGEGTFVWRVSAFNADGLQGPWSQMHRFRVVDPSARHAAASQGN